jgi:hypothetical protein
MLNAVNLLLTDARGVYIPQHFCELYVNDARGQWTGIGDWPRGECLAGPDTDGYWDAWDDILTHAKYTSTNGKVYTLYQDGDLWLLCYDDMSVEEKHNFGFEE